MTAMMEVTKIKKKFVVSVGLTILHFTKLAVDTDVKNIFYVFYIKVLKKHVF